MSTPKTRTPPAGIRIGLNEAEIAALPAVLDIVTAGRLLGIGKTRAYELAQAGEFPVPTLRVGSRTKVSKHLILVELGLRKAS